MLKLVIPAGNYLIPPTRPLQNICVASENTVNTTIESQVWAPKDDDYGNPTMPKLYCMSQTFVANS